MAATTTPLTAAGAFWSTAVDEDTPAPISYDRCTDWLLDLYQSTDDTGLKDLVAEVLDDLRQLAAPIEGELQDVVLGALASVEIAFEVAEARSFAGQA